MQKYPLQIQNFVRNVRNWFDKFGASACVRDATVFICVITVVSKEFSICFEIAGRRTPFSQSFPCVISSKPFVKILRAMIEWTGARKTNIQFWGLQLTLCFLHTHLWSKLEQKVLGMSESSDLVVNLRDSEWRFLEEPWWGEPPSEGPKSCFDACDHCCASFIPIYNSDFKDKFWGCLSV